MSHQTNPSFRLKTRSLRVIKLGLLEGDTSIINAWFKGETYQDPFVITVYVECETAEELEEVTADEEIEQDKRSRNDFLEPVEINL